MDASEHQLLQSLINGKLFTLNGDAPKPVIGPKILTPQETWELIVTIVKTSLTPSPELEDEGARSDPVQGVKGSTHRPGDRMSFERIGEGSKG
jgi:hypothetical protein